MKFIVFFIVLLIFYELNYVFSYKLSLKCINQSNYRKLLFQKQGVKNDDSDLKSIPGMKGYYGEILIII